jgi:hypothetical protein
MAKKKAKKKTATKASVAKAIANFEKALKNYSEVLMVQADIYKKKALKSKLQKRIARMKKSLKEIKAVTRRL